MGSSSRTIIVSGMIAADPGQGGATWAVLQYVLGLRRLGHDVHFIEPIPPASLPPPVRLCKIRLMRPISAPSPISLT